MPELPEVETVRRGLQRLVVGRVISRVEVLTQKSFGVVPPADLTSDLLGAGVTQADRRGKVMILELSTGAALVAHLKMTGQLVFVDHDHRWGAGHPNDSLVDALPDRSTRVIISFDDGAHLYFNDQRKFGWLHLMPGSAVAAIPLIASMGPEPLEGDPAPEFLRRMRRHPSLKIKAAILNQAVLAGVGNIYADEALWAAKIHPRTLVSRLSDQELALLLESAQAVMRTSIDYGGSTDRNYVDAEGKRGNYLSFAHVFRREGQPCPRCGAIIEKIRVVGRGTHICPNCQVEVV
ncbi:MAG: DNA-formamidopyrimidine glycosylase [Propionibacteriaceae bacterium]|jgi:formamidopyrimidine-DNA glycosylase|nr:DNA-formamidopyrimidine glycosylase [Propionibacteriaceae bacterium]